MNRNTISLGSDAGCFRLVYVIYYRDDEGDFWRCGDTFTPYPANARKMADTLCTSLRRRGLKGEVRIVAYALDAAAAQPS